MLPVIVVLAGAVRFFFVVHAPLAVVKVLCHAASNKGDAPYDRGVLLKKLMAKIVFEWTGLFTNQEKAEFRVLFCC